MSMSLPGALANWKDQPKEAIASEALTLRQQNAGLVADLGSVMQFARSRLPQKVGPISTAIIALAGACQVAGINVFCGPWGLLINGVLVGAETIGAALVHGNSPNAFAALHGLLVGQGSAQAALTLSAWLTTWNAQRIANNQIGTQAAQQAIAAAKNGGGAAKGGNAGNAQGQ